jgi:hypothetical protein
MFSITSSRAKGENTALGFSYSSGPVQSADFTKPQSFQRAFDARGSIRFEFGAVRQADSLLFIEAHTRLTLSRKLAAWAVQMNGLKLSFWLSI